MNKPTRYFSSHQEDKVAKLLGGRTQPNSGATPFFKGDVIAKDFVIECKTTTKLQRSFSIKWEWLADTETERIQMRKGYCALAFSFCEKGKNFFVVDEDTFRKMFDALMEHEGK